MKDADDNERCSDASLSMYETHASVGNIIEAVSSELVGLGDAGAALQAMLKPTERPDREGLQALDLFTQRLFALAEFLATLKSAIGTDCRVDPAAALATVCLSDMARRLESGSYPLAYRDLSSTLSAEVEAGVMDLF